MGGWRPVLFFTQNQRLKTIQVDFVIVVQGRCRGFKKSSVLLVVPGKDAE
jgi:hypothetical protein